MRADHHRWQSGYVTLGDADYLRPGRKGVFYDRDGRDWDATVVRVLEHPISIGQAFWLPYKRIGRTVSDIAERILGDADRAIIEDASSGLTPSSVGMARATGAAKSGIDTGMLAAIGLATTSLISGLSAVVATVMGLPLWKVPLVIVGVALAISGPSVGIAMIKLRQRTLGPLLEGNGWAVNGRVAINLRLGEDFTKTRVPPIAAAVAPDRYGVDRRLGTRWRLALGSATLVLFTLVMLLMIGATRYAWVNGDLDVPLQQARLFLGMLPRSTPHPPHAPMAPKP